MAKSFQAQAFLFARTHKLILIILILALAVRLFFFFGFHELWWDSGVYVGMGKYLFSLGESGLWEHIRPAFWPVMLGFLWSIKLSPVFFGRILELLMSLGIIFLVYLISLHYFGKKTALIASAITAFSSVFFSLGFHLYSEIPSLFFALIAVYVFAKERYYLAGLFSGIAFASKFPAGIFIACLAISLIFLTPSIKKYSYLFLGFATVILPYLLLNQVTSGSALLPFTDASRTIKEVLGCNVLRYKPFYYYLYLPLLDNFLHISAIAGIYFYFKSFAKARLLAFICLSVPFIYFAQLHCREDRYFVLFMPFLAMFTAYGIYSIFEYACKAKRSKSKKRLFICLLAAILIISAAVCIFSYAGSRADMPANSAEDRYLRYLQGKSADNDVWSSNPLISVYTDIPISKIYYPVYNAEVADSFYRYLQANASRISYVFLDNCGGGIICADADEDCKKTTEDIIYFLSDYELVYNQTYGRCYYYVYGLSSAHCEACQKS